MSSFPSTICWKTVLSSLNGLGKLTICGRIYFWALYSIPLVYMSPLCHDYTAWNHSCILSFELMKHKFSDFSFKNVLVIWHSLKFHMNFGMSFPIPSFFFFKKYLFGFTYSFFYFFFWKWGLTVLSWWLIDSSSPTTTVFWVAGVTCTYHQIQFLFGFDQIVLSTP